MSCWRDVNFSSRRSWVSLSSAACLLWETVTSSLHVSYTLLYALTIQSNMLIVVYFSYNDNFMYIFCNPFFFTKDTLLFKYRMQILHTASTFKGAFIEINKPLITSPQGKDENRALIVQTYHIIMHDNCK